MNNVITILENRMASKDEKKEISPKNRKGQMFARLLVGEDEKHGVILWKSNGQGLEITPLNDRGNELDKHAIEHLKNFQPLHERLNLINKYHPK